MDLVGAKSYLEFFEMMGWQKPMTCPECGQPLFLMNNGKPIATVENGHLFGGPFEECSMPDGECKLEELIPEGYDCDCSMHPCPYADRDEQPCQWDGYPEVRQVCPDCKYRGFTIKYDNDFLFCTSGHAFNFDEEFNGWYPEVVPTDRMDVEVTEQNIKDAIEDERKRQEHYKELQEAAQKEEQLGVSDEMSDNIKGISQLKDAIKELFDEEENNKQ